MEYFELLCEFINYYISIQLIQILTSRRFFETRINFLFLNFFEIHSFLLTFQKIFNELNLIICNICETRKESFIFEYTTISSGFIFFSIYYNIFCITKLRELLVIALNINERMSSKQKFLRSFVQLFQFL